MPQQSLLPEHPPMVALRIEITTPAEPGYDSRIAVQVKRRGQPDFWTCSVWTPLGSEADYVDTYVNAAASAYLYGETPADVARALKDVVRLARQHGMRSGF